jgi:hypothetical protein
MKVDLQETLKVRGVIFLHFLISALYVVTSFSLRPFHPSRNISLIPITEQPYVVLEVSGGGNKSLCPTVNRTSVIQLAACSLYTLSCKHS